MRQNDKIQIKWINDKIEALRQAGAGMEYFSNHSDEFTLTFQRNLDKDYNDWYGCRCNHAEIKESVAKALGKLAKAGVDTPDKAVEVLNGVYAKYVTFSTFVADERPGFLDPIKKD